jgi:hypothetical protein
MADRFRQFLDLEIRKQPSIAAVAVGGTTREFYDVLSMDQIVHHFRRFLQLNFKEALRGPLVVRVANEISRVKTTYETRIVHYDVYRRSTRPMDVWMAMQAGHPRDDLIHALDRIADGVARHWHGSVNVNRVVVPGPLRAAVRPLRPGYSVAYQGSRSSGTIGAFIRSRGTMYLLSNAHILVADPFAAMDSGNIIQPSPADGGTGLVGAVAHHCRMLNGAQNPMDAAIAALLPTVSTNPDYQGIGSLTGLRNARLGETLRMVSRTSGYTEAVVDHINHLGQVGNWLNPGHAAVTFSNVVVLRGRVGGHTNLEGDSGGLWIGQDNKAVALNFGGGEWSDTALAIPITTILTFFQTALNDVSAGLVGIDNSALR